MTDLTTLEKKVLELEERVRKLEKFSSNEDELYAIAKDLVAKNPGASVSFLQKKLWIDFERASRIMLALKAEGLIN